MIVGIENQQQQRQMVGTFLRALSLPISPNGTDTTLSPGNQGFCYTTISIKKHSPQTVVQVVLRFEFGSRPRLRGLFRCENTVSMYQIIGIFLRSLSFVVVQ